MKYIIQIIRFFVGGLFVLSGFVKLVDPKGTSYKLYDYFAEDVLNLTFLQDFVLPLSFVFVVAEVILGIFLLLGIFKKFTVYSLLGLIVFFTFLTFYSAYFDKVKDCGCFGDALKLKPWKSFYKDLILLITIIILLIGQRYIQPLFSTKLNLTLATMTTVISFVIAYWGIERLPIIDFRPYAIGENLKENIKDVKEPIIQINYTLKNSKTGKSKVIDSKTYVNEDWWKNKDWEMQSDLTTEEVIDEGIPARIHDFVIQDEEFTNTILNQNQVFLIINYDPLTLEEQTRLYSFIDHLKKEKKIYYVLSSEEMEGIDKVYSLDGTVLKTMIRSSPGVILIDKGIVKRKWHWKELSELEKLKSFK
ncbi:MAG: BT_3928 family protein [Flavobacteriales bacterium]